MCCLTHLTLRCGLLQTRRKRMDERQCATLFNLFYPVCYSDEDSSVPFGPNYKVRAFQPLPS